MYTNTQNMMSLNHFSEDGTRNSFRDKSNQELVAELQHQIQVLKNEIKFKDSQHQTSTNKLLKEIEDLIEKQKKSDEDIQNQIKLEKMVVTSQKNAEMKQRLREQQEELELQHCQDLMKLMSRIDDGDREGQQADGDDAGSL